ncbi:Bro-N domain-containing protein [Candidatus Saccharibacteria bacterium]|nr:Bro-N domain-containing protein [Candidatus Saccharibacteria bacterium]
MKDKLQLFEQRQVRSVWDEENGKWWFAVADVIAVLTDQPDYTKTRNYWKWLKNKLTDEGSQLVSNTNQLKLVAPDGKMRLTDVMDTEQILRLVQSIPSKKAEPFKLWLAKVGRERIDEVQDPELTINRAMHEYRSLGYDEDWINLRLQSIQVRKGLTDEWDKSGVQQGAEYAFLTDLMYKTWADMTTREYKKFKDLKKENLRDNMTNLELVVNMLAEASATELSTVIEPADLRGSATVAEKGAKIAKNARRDIEKQGGKVISSRNAGQLGRRKAKELDEESS